MENFDIIKSRLNKENINFYFELEKAYFDSLNEIIDAELKGITSDLKLKAILKLLKEAITNSIFNNDEEKKIMNKGCDEFLDKHLNSKTKFFFVKEFKK